MARRKFTREFKLSAVQLVNHQGYSISGAAKSLGVDPNCVRYGNELKNAKTNRQDEVRELLEKSVAKEAADAD